MRLASIFRLGVLGVLGVLGALGALGCGAVGCGAFGCGADNTGSDARDATSDSGIPPPPVLGAQIDRMGRPGITTMLIGLLASGTARTAQEDAYNQAADPASWRTTVIATNVTVALELQTNLAVFDAIDLGLTIPSAGCGNALLYAVPPGPLSYQEAVNLFADDQLYIDTDKPTCTTYLALEIEQTSRGSLRHTTCGGRTLTYDTIDVMYSVLASGLEGLDGASELAPMLRDGVDAHTDMATGFPFLGAPH